MLCTLVCRSPPEEHQRSSERFQWACLWSAVWCNALATGQRPLIIPGNDLRDPEEIRRKHPRRVPAPQIGLPHPRPTSREIQTFYKRRLIHLFHRHVCHAQALCFTPGCLISGLLWMWDHLCSDCHLYFKTAGVTTPSRARHHAGIPHLIVKWGSRGDATLVLRVQKQAHDCQLENNLRADTRWRSLIFISQIPGP